MQNFMGMDGFIWFTGVVEDRNDPSKLGRVRVRCVGHHTDDKSKIPTADLPWAHVMHPVTDPSMSGMGNTPPFMVEGTQPEIFWLGIKASRPFHLLVGPKLVGQSLKMHQIHSKNYH